MSLSERQRLFARYVGMLLRWIYANGYEVTFGDAFRSPEQAELNAKSGKGVADSLHCKRLAIDLNLFVKGLYVTNSDAYKPLGEYWESLDPLCRWGGSFRRIKDGNHFELREKT